MSRHEIVWVEQFDLRNSFDLGNAEVLAESRRHLDFLRSQLRATSDAIDSARLCIGDSWEMLDRFNRQWQPGPRL